MKESALRCVTALLAAAGDSEEDVRAQVIQSTRQLAARDLIGVLEVILKWLQENKPGSVGTSSTHRYTVCRVLVEILRAHAAPTSVPQRLVLELCQAMSVEFTSGNDLNSEWALEASTACVILCDLCPSGGSQCLLDQVPHNALPHNFILKTISDFAACSPVRFAPYIREWMAKLLPILGLAKQDNHRIILSNALTAFSEAVNQLSFCNDGDLTPRSQPSRSVTRADFADGMYTALTMLLNEWSKTSEARVRGPVFGAIGMLSCLLADAQRATLLPKIVPAVITAIKKDKPKDQRVVARGACVLASFCSPTLQPDMLAQVESMLQCCTACVAGCIADRMSTTTDERPAAAAPGGNGKTHATTTLPFLTQWAESIADIAADATLTFLSKSLDAKHGSKDPIARAASLTLLKHLVSRRHLDTRFATFKDSIVAIVKLALSDADVRVRRVVVGTIMAMGTNPSIEFFGAVGAQDLLTYLIKQAGIGQRAVDDYDNHAAKNAKEFATGALQEVREAARGALVVFTSLPALDKHLWPRLFEHVACYVADPDLANAFPTLARAVASLADRVSQTDGYYIDFRVSVNLPKPGTLATVCLLHAIVAGSPCARLGGAINSDLYSEAAASMDVSHMLRFMTAIAPLLDEPFLYQHAEEVPTPVASLWLGTIPELTAFLQQKENRAPAVAASVERSNLAVADGAPALQPSQLLDGSLDAWEDVMCKFITRTVSARGEAEWAEQFVNASIALFPVFAPCPLLQRACLIVAGIALSKTTRRELVVSSIDALIDMVDPSFAELRTGLTKGLAFVATQKDYADIVIDKVSALGKGPEKKGGFFSSFGKKEEKGGRREVTEASRAVAASTMCWLPRRMNVTLLVSRFDTAIVPVVTAVIRDSPDPDVKLCAVSSLLLMEPALRKAPADFLFKSRDAVLEELMSLAQGVAAPLSVSGPGPKAGWRWPLQMVTACVRAMTSLIGAVAQPPVSAATFDNLIAFLIAACIPCRISPESRGELLAEGDATSEKVFHQLMCDLVTNMMANSLVNDIDRVVGPLLQPAVSAKATDMERTRCAVVAHTAIQRGRERLEAAMATDQGATCVMSFGTVVGRLCPRVMDAQPRVRELACDILSDALSTMRRRHNDVFAPLADTIDVDAVAASLVDSLKARAVDCSKVVRSAYEKEVNSVSKQLCAAIVTVFPTPELFCPLLDALLSTGLIDPQPDAASCSCVVLHGVVRGVGGLLSEQQARAYLETMVACVDLPSLRESALNGLLVSIRNLTKHHSVCCFNGLLKAYKCPHAPNVIKAVQAVGSDSALAPVFVAHCLDTILNTQLSEDRVIDEKTKKTARDVSHVGTAATCALGWTAQTAKGAEVVLGMRCAVIGGALLFLSAAHEYGSGERICLVAEAIKLLVTHTCSEATNERMERCGWSALANGGSFTIVSGELTKYICVEEIHEDARGDIRLPVADVRGVLYPAAAPTQPVIDFAEFMLPYINKPQRCHRRTAIAVCGRLLRMSLTDDASMLQSLVSSLLGRTGSDEDPVLRTTVIAFFIDILEHPPAQTALLTAPVLSALLSTMEDPIVEVSQIAMTCLKDFSERLPDKAPLRPMVVNVLLKIKGKFEFPDPRLRAASYSLYSSLLQMSIRGELDPTTLEQQSYIHLATALMHIEDDDADVRTASKACFASTMAFIVARQPRSAARAADFLASLPSASTRFDEIANDFAALWISDFPGHVNDFLLAAAAFMGHEKESVRGAAAATCGFLLKHTPSADLSRASTEQVCGILVQAASSGRERSARVRMKAAKALGLLPAL